ncbi:MAG: C45 family peptidase [Thermoplasmata archaeon]|nr:C45 family peptidase [Thermoplasmata archaeon]
MNSSTKKGIAVVAVVVVILAASAAVLLNGGQESEGNDITVTWSDDQKLFYIDVDFDYKFDGYLATGSTTMVELNNYLKENVTNGTGIGGAGSTACSTFAVSDEDGDLLLARNLDFSGSVAAVVHTDPENGYESLSIVNLNVFGYTAGDTPETLAAKDAVRAVAYMPMDGVNEKGVSVSINAVENSGYASMTHEGRTPIFITTALRLILDNADSTDKALELLMDYDLCMAHYHIMISDASGKTAVVEIYDNEYYVVETSYMTNHYVSPDLQGVIEVTESSQSRYDTVGAAMESSEGVMDTAECFDLLETVKQDNASNQTRWSVVYNKTEGTMTLCLVMDFATKYTYSLSSA